MQRRDPKCLASGFFGLLAWLAVGCQSSAHGLPDGGARSGDAGPAAPRREDVDADYCRTCTSSAECAAPYVCRRIGGSKGVCASRTELDCCTGQGSDDGSSEQTCFGLQEEIGQIGQSGSSGVGGSGPIGVAGTGGSGPVAGTGGVDAGVAPQVPCGPTVCTNPFVGNVPIPVQLPVSCCADERTGTCGTSANGVCMPPSTPDPNCPQVASPLPGIVLISCCADNGMCGLDSSMFGMGCVDFATLASQPAGGFIPVPSPTPCGDDDAGI